ncbi:glycosyltransferase family A protein [Acinetobacter sp. MD2]|uniref:glycosyltransferase family 2 protein n=1 Tax=Acinetobacter sp. MD2 TaxID=2600066 RepID=UPI002D1F63EA|nr:glycosyltransferase family A protein [Acinetobacter sp. MD2]MEB3767359.1 glycosyltransferase family 2 protein [Acinetobacter sp. MD2]
MKLSLIIPVYNVERYIEQCLASICQQLPYKNVEIIIVDDGSPDQAIAKAKRFLQQQPDDVRRQFKVVQQKNQGLSGARNTGIAEAKGEYVAFLDSDDYLNQNYFAQIFQGIESNADIIQFAVQRVDDAGNKIPFLHPMSKQGLHGIDRDILLELSNRSAWFAWLRVYKTSLFGHIRFPVGKNYEDAYTTPFLFFAAQTAYFSPEVLINYRINPTGITATKSRKNIDDLGGVPVFYLKHLAQHPELAASLIAISQSHIMDVLNVDGVAAAQRRWGALKTQIQQQKIQADVLRNRGNRLFLKYGVWFLLFDRSVRRLGLKK